MQVRAGRDLAEKFEQWPRAEAMETASQITEALAWKRLCSLRGTSVVVKFVGEPACHPLTS